MHCPVPADILLYPRASLPLIYNYSFRGKATSVVWTEISFLLLIYPEEWLTLALWRLQPLIFITITMAFLHLLLWDTKTLCSEELLMTQALINSLNLWPFLTQNFWCPAKPSGLVLILFGCKHFTCLAAHLAALVLIVLVFAQCLRHFHGSFKQF